MNKTITVIYTIFTVAAVAVTLYLNNGTTLENSRENDTAEIFTTEVINGYTPVKNQGKSTLCWAYAMLAAIETEHIMRGDSVHLSVKYAARCLLEERSRQSYLTRDTVPVAMRGMGGTLLCVMERHGMVAYDAYRDDPEADIMVLANKVKRTVHRAIRTRSRLGRTSGQVTALLDETLGTAPRRVFMYGAEYTPGEFARSVCSPGEYVGLTSFTHHPFYTRFALEVPDNTEHNEFYNVPIDTLMATIERAVRTGHGVCWESDTSEPGFSFHRGTATLPVSSDTSQEARQLASERFSTTDDHCMSIVGLARDAHGRRFYIMKNSWGTNNPYGGLMYVSEDYMRMKTVAVYMVRMNGIS